MKGHSYSSGDFSAKSPSWYWTAGLHDAQIIRVEALEFSYDYKNPHSCRNCLNLYIDASGALFDQAVKVIRLFNYKILSNEMHSFDGCFWLEDQLKYTHGKYILELTLWHQDVNEFQCAIQFQDAEVERK